MRLSFITPVTLLKQYGEESDFLFVEAAIFLKSQKFRNYVYQWQKAGKDICLDNSAFLLEGRSMVLPKYLSVIKAVKPDRIIVPDILQDWRATVDLARTSIAPIRNVCPNAKLIGVPHGKNISEWLVCADFLFNDLKCNILGLTMALPNINDLQASEHPDGDFRSTWLDVVFSLWKRSYPTLFDRPIHVLGLQHPCELEHLRFLQKRVSKLKLNWNDSGIVFQAAAQYQTLSKAPFEKKQTPFFEDLGFWKDKHGFIRDNIHLIRTMQGSMVAL